MSATLKAAARTQKTTNLAGNDGTRRLSVKTAILFISVFSATACAMNFLGDGSVYSKIVIFIWIFSFAIISGCLFPILRRDRSGFVLLFGPPFVYFLFAWLWRAIWIAFDIPQHEVYFVAINSPFDEKIFESSLIAAMLTTLGAGSGLLAGAVISASSKKERNWARHDLSLKRLLILGALSLVAKFICHYVLKWGIPGAEPENPIKVVTGFLTIYVRVGLFAIVVLAIYLDKKSKSNLTHLATLLVALTYVIMDMGIGSKYSLVYLSFAFVCIAFYPSWEAGRISKRMLLLSAVAVSITGLTYGLINYYRFARLSGISNFRESVDYIMHYKSQGDRGMDMSISGRINGFDGFYHVVQNKDTLNAGIGELVLESEFSRDYTTSLTGVENDRNAAGSTQNGIIYLITNGNLFHAFLVAFVLSAGVVVSFAWSSRFLLKNTDLIKVSFLIGGILAVYVQFGSGNLLYFAKEWVVIVGTLAVLRKFIESPVGRVAK